MTEVTVTVDVDTQVVQMVCAACRSKLAILLRAGESMRALRFCPCCGSQAAFFNAEDRPR